MAESVETDASTSDGADYFTVYSEHSNTLRTWLTAYGIGGPVLILSQDNLWKALSDAHALRDVAILFLAGVFLQVLLAAVNKSVMWACYYGETTKAYQKTHRYKLASWISETYAIDVAVDLFSIIFFIIATYKCFTSLVVS